MYIINQNEWIESLVIIVWPNRSIINYILSNQKFKPLWYWKCRQSLRKIIYFILIQTFFHFVDLTGVDVYFFGGTDYMSEFDAVTRENSYKGGKFIQISILYKREDMGKMTGRSFIMNRGYFGICSNISNWDFLKSWVFPQILKMLSFLFGHFFSWEEN